MSQGFGAGVGSFPWCRESSSSGECLIRDVLLLNYCTCAFLPGVCKRRLIGEACDTGAQSR